MNVEFQSFVVAAVVAAILLADRLGLGADAPRRLYQVALGFALAFVVMSATTAFIRSDAASLGDLANADLSFLSSTEGSGNSAREAAAVQSGAGLVLLLLGFAAAQRWSTLPLAAAFGGFLLLLSGGDSGGFDLNSFGSNPIFGMFLGRAEEGRDIAHFVVVLVGTVLLLGLGYRRWETEQTPAVSAAPS